jgi:trans-2,3-dihydro-3-hydroxyanthranilate isomerase
MNHDFYILDVFAENKYAGNQLAVVLDFERTLSDEQMQEIASEMHFSETTFIRSEMPSENGYDVRIFTPAIEVPFAGHPTVGTAWVIRKMLHHQAETITLNLKAGQIPVNQTADDSGSSIFWLTALQPEFGTFFAHADFASVLNLELEDFDNEFPVQVVSTGIPFNLVPLKDIRAVKRAKMNMSAFEPLIEKRQAAQAIFMFCAETIESDNHIHARMFADLYGIPEDPATGSANSCLAAYLAHYQFFSSTNVDIRVEQGYEMNRPSRLYLKASIRDNHYDVKVGGHCILTAQGNLV